MLTLEKGIKYILLASLVFPLVFISWTMFPWNFGKTFFFQILIDLLLFGAVFYFIAQKKHIFRFSIIDWLVFAFFGSQLLSAFFGIDHQNSFFGDQARTTGVFTYLHFTLFYFLLRQFFSSKKDWMQASLIMFIVAVIASILAWLGLYSSFFSDIFKTSGGLSGLSGNQIFFASYITIPLFLAFYLLFENSQESGVLNKYFKNKWIYIIGGLFLLLSLVWTQERGPFVGLLAGAFFVWLAFSFTSTFSKEKKNRIFYAGLVLLLLFGAFYFLNQKHHFTDNRLFNINLHEQTADTRLMAWGIAWQGFKEHPLLGYGTNNYRDIFDSHYNPAFFDYSFSETVWDKPHNNFFEILGGQGIVGALVYIALIYFVLQDIFLLLKKEENKARKIALVFLAGGFVAYVVQNLFAFDTSNSLQIWFLFLALIAFLSSKNREKNHDTDQTRWVLSVLFVVFACYAMYWNYNMLKSSYYMSTARDYKEIGSIYKWKENALKTIDMDSPFTIENAVFLTKDLTDFDKSSSLNADQLSSVTNQIENVFLKNIDKKPNSYLYHLWLGQLYSLNAQYIDNSYFEKSDAEFQKAGETSKGRQNIPMLLSQNYLLEGKTDEAITTLEQFVKDNPQRPEPHWFLGLAYIQAKDNEKGLSELEEGLKGFKTKKNLIYMTNLYIELEKYENAIPVYDDLIQIDKENEAYYIHDKGLMYFAIGEKDKAMELFKEAIKLNPALKDGLKAFFEANKLNINELDK